jgi:ribosome biogenesis protein SSF1/2
VKESEDPATKGQPKSFVLRRGRHASLLKDLDKDLRKLMSPNTATALKQHKKNVLKDFVHVAGPLGVTHFLLLSATNNASYLRIGKSPRGPTVTFKIHEYSLMRDVMASLQRPRCPQSVWLTHPLVVMNAFNSAPSEDSEHLKLVSVMFQNLFPTINVTTTKLSTCQRVLLLEYSAETKRITLRHYSIAVKAAGVAKNLKKLLDRRRETPDLGSMRDISELMTKSGYGSESEGEDAEAGKVELEDTTPKGEVRGTRQSRIKLTEIGPRLELEVIKIEESLCDGKVLYHRYESRTAEEVAAKDSEIEEKKKIKDERRKEQEANVKRKQAAKKMKEDAKKAKKDSKKKEQWWEKEEEKPRDDKTGTQMDHDIEWYIKEVGEKPDEEFLGTGKGKGKAKKPNKSSSGKRRK